MTPIEQKIFETGIIPVIKIDDAKNAVPLAKALVDGGLAAAEVTFRTSAAAESIKAISQAFPQMLVGAGTVLTTEQVDAAVEAGATFIVSPGLNPTIVKYCQSKNIPIIPGVATPSDVEKGIELGLKTLKFFPAEANGGLNYLKAICAPYGNIKFMPTGGINENNILSYLSFDKILACGGSFMVKDEYIKNGEFDKIKELTANAVSLMHGFKIVHIGINAENSESAHKLADSMAVFDQKITKESNSSMFLNNEIEIMKKPWYGKMGHIAIQTNNIKRAEAYLKSKGIKFIEETKNIDAKGNYGAVYMEGDYCGFSLHLVQKK